MLKWKSIPIPEKMKLLEKDARGYPISFTTIRDEKGQPFFPISDEYKVYQVADERKCGICGKKLEDDIWIVGGPLPAFHPGGAYLDPAIHYECGTYALQVCPYLAVPIYSKKIHEEGVKGKPPFFVFAKISDYKIIPMPSTKTYIAPAKPLLKVEYWLNGAKINRETAEALFIKDPVLSKYFNAGKGISVLPLSDPDT
jgi:hypothetical protein